MMTDAWRITFTIFVLSLVHSATAAERARPAVLELYTSEGCSSCPPAEALINELAKRPEVLALSFHVDYWNDLGWRDRYSLASATERQHRYARSLRRSSLYTPQAVVDGVLDVVGSDRTAVTQAVSGRREGIPTSISVDNGLVQIAVGPGGDATPADVVLLSYQRQATTYVGRGENSGRTLQESNIVRSIEVLGQWSGKAQQFRVDVASLPKDVTDIAVLIQSVGQGSIVGAVARSIR